MIALVGTLRYTAHRSIPEIHQALCDRGIQIAERTVTHLLHRYEELVTVHLEGQCRLRDRFKEQGQIVLAIDGLQPDVGHEVLWVLRDCLSGEVLLARSLLSACEADLAHLLREVQQMIDVPIRGVISDGQRSLRNAVQTMWPDIPHQLCHFHSLREAARPVYEADKHAKKELKKRLRGVRPIERAVEQRKDEEAEAIRGSCLAVHSALTDDGRPPLAAPREAWPQPRTKVAAIIDSQSIKTSAVRGDERGYDGGKRVLGRKRHLLVDTQGFLLAVKVHAANILDRHAAPLLLAPLVGRFPRLHLIWADSGYNGTCKQWIKEYLGIEVEIVNHPWTGIKGRYRLTTWGTYCCTPGLRIKQVYM